LIGPAAKLPPLRRKSYVRARLVYRKSGDAGGLKKISWPVDPHRHAVLSSGGKESLLSYCLLRERGQEVHPVYVTESGRHWYTALNAYRHFSGRLPFTAKVWTNVDRVMCFIERRLSFVRPNFHDSPSDEYPIRLWTLPLFLFGVLPLARARGIGSILIGDEYDTSRLFHHRGIPHYDGLYDQSRFFDNFMTRYYQRKGWGFIQFSVVRPMSELLVEKILVKRYPEIQRHQVSCHATHIKNHRVKPCGNCEKCRRIVGMMLALGEDPHRCGYSTRQIHSVLRFLPSQSFRQESAGALQMAYLLRRRKLYQKPVPDPGGRGPHPEVLQLRFDRDHSPLAAIPSSLRRPIYSICLKYADGAVRLEAGRWKRFNLLRHPDLKRPYPFEPSQR
jgi:hypothetical protein